MFNSLWPPAFFINVSNSGDICWSLIFISLISDVKHILMYLLAIYACFFGKMSTLTLCLILIRLFGFIALEVDEISYTYFFYISPLAGMWHINIFSHSIHCLSFCWWLHVLCRNFFFNKVTCLFCCISFGVRFKKMNLSTPVSRNLPLCFF